jgi:hypothetical protein
MFPVYGWKCLSRKWVHNWVADVSLMTKRFETEVRKWLRQSKDFYAEGFDALVKRWTSVSMLVEDLSRNKCFFKVRIFTRFTFYISLLPVY